MIRHAGLNDRIAMVRMARDFVAAADMAMPFDAAYAERSAKEWITADDKLALVLDLGGICGMLCGAHVLSPLAPVKVAIEQVFWIDPAKRGRSAIKMIAAYEEWAIDQGCNMATLATIQSKGADRLYSRLGYARAETHYAKAI